MGAAAKEHTSKCPCYTKPQALNGFQQIIELKEEGYVVYRFTTPTADVDNTRMSQCGIILHKMKNMNTSTSTEVLPQLDLNKFSCPRCRHTLKHAQELLDKIPGSNKSNILGICDHCQLKAQSQSYEPCNECENIIIKFLLASKQKEDLHKYIKIWLSNMRDRLKKKDKSRYIKHRSYSDMNLNLLNMQKTKSPCKIKTELMFRSEEYIPDIIDSKPKKDQEKRTANLEKTKYLKGVYESKFGKTSSDGSKSKEEDEHVTRQLRSIQNIDLITKYAQHKDKLSISDGKLQKGSDYTSEATIMSKSEQKTKKTQILRPLVTTDLNAIRKQDATKNSKERLEETQELVVRKKGPSKDDRTDTHTAPEIKTVTEKDKVETDERKAKETQKNQIKKLKTKDVKDLSMQNLKRQKSFKDKSIQVKMESKSKEENKVKTDESKTGTSLDVLAKKKRTGVDKQKTYESKRETLADVLAKRKGAGEDKLKSNEIKKESSADILTKKKRAGADRQKADESKRETPADVLAKRNGAEDKLKTHETKRESLADILAKKKRAGEDKQKTDENKKESSAVFAKNKRAGEGKQKVDQSKIEASTDVVDKKVNIAADLEFKKPQAQVAKDKADELKKQKEFELEEEKKKELAEGKIKDAMKAIQAQEIKPSKDFKPSKKTQINADAIKMAEPGVNKKEPALDIPEKERLNTQHTIEESEFKKLQAQLTKNKAEELKKQKEFEAEERKRKDLAEEKIKGVLKTIPAENAKSITKGETQPAPKREKLTEKGAQTLTDKEIEKELKLLQIKLLRPSLDDTILKLFKIRQSKQTLKDATKITETESKMTDLLSKSENNRIQEDITDKKPIENIIIGKNMAKYRPPFLPQEHIEREVIPITFQRQIDVSPIASPKAEIIEEMSIKMIKEASNVGNIIMCMYVPI